MSSNNQQLYEVAICLVPGVGNYLTRQLIAHCGNPENVFKEKKGKLLKIPGIGNSIASAIADPEILIKAELEIKSADKRGISLLFYSSKLFPERLKSNPDAPALLYFKGNANLNASKVISIVGTRNSTDYGKEVVEQVIQELNAYEDLLIVSGLAYGIDIAAHKNSLKHNIPTVAVMATGLDIIYPSAHSETAGKIIENGGLLTEYCLGSKPEPPKFPARNRIIAGMCDVVLVVEAAAKGGALITAEIANTYNKEIFSVPGDINNKYSEGCNNLIRDHKAHIYTSIKDIEYIMGWSESLFNTSIASKDYDHLDPESKEVIALLQKNESMPIDELSWQIQIPLSKLASLLLHLEFEGIVKSLPGKKYKLLNT